MAYFKCSSGKGKGGINTKAFLYSIDESQGGVWTNSHIDITELSKLIFTYSENSIDKYTAEFNVSDIVVYSGSGADVFTTVFPAAISTNAFNVRIYNDELWVSYSGVGDTSKAVSIYKDITQQLMGVTNIISGTDIPANSNGVDGQIYLRYNDEYTNHIFMDGAIVVQEKPNDNTYLKLFIRGLTKTTSDIAITDSDLLSYLSDITNGYLKACDSYDTAESDTQTGVFAISNDNGSILIRTYVIGWTQYKAGTFYGVIDLTEPPVAAQGSPEYQRNGNIPCLVGIFQTYLKVNGVWEELLGEDINDVIPDNALSYLIKEDSTPISGEGTDGQLYIEYGLPKGALLHFEDSATEDEFGNTWTATNAVVSTDQSKFGTKSLYLNGNARISTEEGNSEFKFNSNDFTIACWIYPTSTSRQALFAFSYDHRIGTDLFYGQSSANMWFSSNGSQWNEIQSDNSGSKTGQGTIALSANTWTHIAYTRKGNKCRMFVNGQLARESTITDGVSVYWANNDTFRIGQWAGDFYGFSGYIDEFLVLNGVCLYDSAFDVPTEPYDETELAKYVKNVYVKSQGQWMNILNQEASLVSNAQPSPTVIKNVLKGTSVPPINKGGSGDMYLRYTDTVKGYDIREYIEVGSTAGPYVNTGCYFSADDEYEVKVQYTDTPDQDTYVFGDWVSNKDTMVGYYDSKFVFAVGSNTYRPTFDTNTHIFYATRNQMLMDGVDTGVLPNWNNTATGWIGLFKHNSHSATKNCKLFYAKMWTSGNLSHDFRPAVRESDDTIGILDIVTGIFYTNNGTGNFTISSTSLEMSNKPVLNPYAKVDGIWKNLIGADVDAINVGEEPKNEIGVKYLKLKINQTRAVPSGGYLQLSEFEIYQNGHLYEWNEEASITSDMQGNSDETIDKLIDGDITTKYCTPSWGASKYNTCNIIIDLKETLVLDANSTYSYVTANDESSRDPISWVLYGSTDGVNWNRLDDRDNTTITTERRTETQEFYFNVLNGDTPEFLCDEGYFVESVDKTQANATIKIIKQSTDGTRVETTYTRAEAESEITIDNLFKFKYQQGSNWLFTVLKDCDGFKAGDQKGWTYGSDADFFIVTKYSWSANYEWMYNKYGNHNYTVTLNSRQYYKEYPHQTLIGYVYRNESYTSPVYVSTYAKAAVFNTSHGGGPFTPNSFVYRGLKWYVSTSGYAMQGDCTDAGAIAIKIPDQTSMENAAKYIIDHCGLTVMKETESTNEIVLFENGEFKNLDKATLDLTSDHQIEDGCIVFGPTTTVSGFTFATNTVNNKYVAYVVGENIGSYDFTIQYGVSTIGYSVDQVVGSGTGRISYETQSTTAGVPFISSIKQDSANTAQGVFIGNHSGSGLEYKISKISLIPYT